MNECITTCISTCCASLKAPVRFAVPIAALPLTLQVRNASNTTQELSTPLLIAAKPVQRMTEYKLLGETVKWDDHVNAITSKAAKRLWFLKKLKRAGVDKQDLL